MRGEIMSRQKTTTKKTAKKTTKKASNQQPKQFGDPGFAWTLPTGEDKELERSQAVYEANERRLQKAAAKVINDGWALAEFMKIVYLLCDTKDLQDREHAMQVVERVALAYACTDDFMRQVVYGTAERAHGA
jgi:hypothetical protein